MCGHAHVWVSIPEGNRYLTVGVKAEIRRREISSDELCKDKVPLRMLNIPETKKKDVDGIRGWMGQSGSSGITPNWFSYRTRLSESLRANAYKFILEYKG